MSEQMDAAQSGELVGGEDQIRDPEAERIARAFHEAYERLAPEFGYLTRAESSVRWQHVPLANRRLMTATVRSLMREGMIV